MPSIDNRVVEMQFNNAKFERGIKTSTDSLGRLKESLNFDKQSASLKQFERYSNSLDFSALQNGIESIKNRFSTLGIVGAEVIRTLTNEAIYLGARIVNSVAAPLQNVTYLMKEGGKQRALNVEQAKFIMEGLKLDFKSFDKDINDAVNGTRFGYDEAAMAASQLAASGVSAKKKLDKSGKEISYMGEALLAISGAAAMTNSEYSDMANIFTTVASNGKLMTEQVRSFSYRGLNITADLAKYFGKTEAQMSDMISKGKIDFQEFAEAVYELYGTQATKADEMLTGVTANIRAAWKKIGQDFWTPIVANNGPIVKGLQKFKDLVNKTIRPSIRSLFEIDGKEFTEDNTWMRLINNIGKAMQKVFGSDYTLKFVERRIKAIGGGVQKVVGAVNSLVTSEHTANILKNTIDGFGNILDTVKEKVLTFGDVVYYAFEDIIPKVTLEEVDKFTKKFSDLSLAFKAIAGVYIDPKAQEEVYKIVSQFNPETATTGVDPSKFQELFDSFLTTYWKLVEIAKSISNVARTIFDTIREAVTSFFKALNVDWSDVTGLIGYLSNIATGVDNFVKKAASFGILNDVATGVAAYFNIIKEAIIDFFSAINIDPDALLGLVKSIGNFVRGISEFVRKVSAVVTTTHIFQKAFTAVSNFFAPIVNFIVGNIELLLDALGRLASWGGNKLADFLIEFNHTFFDAPKEASMNTSPLQGFIDFIVGGLQKIRDGFAFIQAELAPAIEKVKIRILKAMNKILGAFNTDALGTSLKSGGIIAAVMVFQQLFAKYKFKIMNALKNIGDPIQRISKLVTNAISNISSVLSAQVKSIKVERVKTLAEAILIIAGAMFVLSLIPVDQLGVAIGAVTAALIEIGAMLKYLSKLEMGTNNEYLFAGRATGFAIEMIGIAAAILILSIAMKKMASLDPEGLGRAVFAIGMLLLELGAFIKFAQIDKKNKIPTVSLILLAVAVRILAGALKGLGEMDGEAMARGIIGVGLLMAGLVLFTKYVSKEKGLMKTTTALILLSVAVRILAGAVKSMGALDNEGLARGIFGIYSIMLAMVLFTRFVKNSKGFMKTAFAFVILAAAIKIMTSSVNGLAALDNEGLARGILGLYAIMFAMVLFTKYVSAAKGLTRAAIAMVILGAAMTIFAKVISSIGALDNEQLARGLFGLGVALLELGIAMHYLSKDSMSIGAIAGMLLMSVMIQALAAALGKMALIDPEGMALALIALGVALAELVIAMNMLGGGGLSALAKGAAFIMIGIGIGFLAMALEKLSTIEPEKMAIALFGLCVALIAMAAASMVASGPMLMLGSAVALFGVGVGALAWGLAKLAVALIPFVALIVAAGPEIVQFLKDLVVGLAEVLPVLVRGMVEAIGEFFVAATEKIDEWAEAIANLLIMLGQKLIVIIPVLFEVIAVIFKELFKYLGPFFVALGSWLVEKTVQIWEWLKVNFWPMVVTFVSWIWDKFIAFMMWVGQGLAWIPETIGGFLAGIVVSIVETVQSWWNAGVEFVSNLIGGISEKVTEATDFVGQLAQDMIDKVRGFFQDFYDAGAYIVQGIIDGARSLWDDAVGAIKGVGKAMWNKFTGYWQEASPSKRSKWGAEMIVRGIAVGIDKFGYLATRSMGGLNEDMWDTMDWVNDSIVDALNSEADPTITPVLDLSNIQNGANAIDSMFGARTMSLAASADAQIRANRMARLDAIEANTTNADVVAALGLLRGDVNNLNDSFANTQVVLDSGALVGATAKKMDNALGRFRVLKGRGI